jgi:hypothetical protein
MSDSWVLPDGARLTPILRQGGWKVEPWDSGSRRYVFVCAAI